MDHEICVLFAMGCNLQVRCNIWMIRVALWGGGVLSREAVDMALNQVGRGHVPWYVYMYSSIGMGRDYHGKATDPRVSTQPYHWELSCTPEKSKQESERIHFADTCVAVIKIFPFMKHDRKSLWYLGAHLTSSGCGHHPRSLDTFGWSIFFSSAITSLVNAGMPCTSSDTEVATLKTLFVHTGAWPLSKGREAISNEPQSLFYQCRGWPSNLMHQMTKKYRRIHLLLL